MSNDSRDGMVIETSPDVKKNLDKAKISTVNEHVEEDVKRERGGRLTKRFVVSFVFAVMMILAIVFAHDVFIKQEYMSNMKRLSDQIAAYREANNHLPSNDEFLEFSIYSRSMDLNKLNYDKSKLLDGFPGETILAWSPKPKFRLITSGYAVLYLDGSTAWIDEGTLQEQVKKREQLYNMRMIQNN